MAEHLDNTLVSDVVTILRPTVSLGNPCRFTFFSDDITNVIRQMSGATIEIFDVVSRPFHLEHLVTFTDIYHQLINHQVGSEVFQLFQSSA